MASSRPDPSPREAPTSGFAREMPTKQELLHIASSTLKTGGLAGTLGTLFGTGVGIARAAPPVLFGLTMGIQWFALGSSYTASKQLLWHTMGGHENMKSVEYVISGGIAGGVSGMCGGIVRGPKNIVPGIVVFSTLGAGSSLVAQAFGSSIKDSNDAVAEPKPKKGILNSKWSPLTPLSDKDYEKRLEEKLLRLNAEIAIIDDNIASLRAASVGSSQIAQQAANKGSSPKT